MTSTRRSARSGLGKAYTSVMSAIGSARARGPEMWSDIAPLSGRLACCLVKQRLQGRLLQCGFGFRIVEHLLECLVHTLSLPDLLHRAAVISSVGSRRFLGAQDERLHRRKVWKAFVPFDVVEDRVEKLQRWPRREEVVHVGIPWAVKARREQQPRVVVEEH